MTYKCTNCNNSFSLPTGAKYCPMCGSELKVVSLEEKVVAAYKEGKTPEKIAGELRINRYVLNQVLAKAIINGLIPETGLVQPEYKEQIEAVLKDNWDGKLKTVKEHVDENCTYTTICYYAKLYKSASMADRIETARSMIRKGVDVDTIINETDTTTYIVEDILIEEIKKDKAIANPYINNDYKAKIMEIANNPEWDRKLRSIKEQLPDEVTYTNIKATLAKADF